MLETIFDILSCLCFPFKTAKERQVDSGYLDITENPESVCEKEREREKYLLKRFSLQNMCISITVTVLL